MIKNVIPFLIFLLFNNICFAEDLTTNSYRKVIKGVDFLNHEYLLIESDSKIEIYSMEQLFTQHNRVSSIILTPENFSKLVSEFKQ